MYQSKINLYVDESSIDNSVNEKLFCKTNQLIIPKFKKLFESLNLVITNHYIDIKNSNKQVPIYDLISNYRSNTICTTKICIIFKLDIITNNNVISNYDEDNYIYQINMLNDIYTKTYNTTLQIIKEIEQLLNITIVKHSLYVDYV